MIKVFNLSYWSKQNLWQIRLFSFIVSSWKQSYKNENIQHSNFVMIADVPKTLPRIQIFCIKSILPVYKCCKFSKVHVVIKSCPLGDGHLRIITLRCYPKKISIGNLLGRKFCWMMVGWNFDMTKADITWLSIQQVKETYTFTPTLSLARDESNV